MIGNKCCDHCAPDIEGVCRLKTATSTQATRCPPTYPKCYSDGDCVIGSCSGGGCAWSLAPSIDTDPSGTHNYINGFDNMDTACSGDYQDYQDHDGRRLQGEPKEPWIFS